MKPETRRRKARVPFSSPVFVEEVEGSSESGPLRTGGCPVTVEGLDLSEEGMGLRVPRRVLPGSLVKVSFRMVLDRELSTVARVVWSDGRRAGLRFLMLDPPLRKAVCFYVQSRRRRLT